LYLSICIAYLVDEYSEPLPVRKTPREESGLM